MTLPAERTPPPPSRPTSEVAAGTRRGALRPTEAIVHLGHIRANVAAIRAKVGAQRKLWAVVKADAYGHGFVPVAKACLKAGASGLAVATADEAVEARRQFPNGTPILLVGPTPPDAALDLVAADVEVGVGDEAMAHALHEASLRVGRPALAHIEVDTGMGRHGFPAETFSRTAPNLTALKGVIWVGMYTHFSVSDSDADDDSRFTQVQKSWLERASGHLTRSLSTGARAPYLHAANSGAILQHKDCWLDGIRPGVMLYGHLPDLACKPSIQLWPAMTWRTRIVRIETYSSGAPLSYGRTYICPGNRRIATLPVGYADGYSRALSNKGQVLIRGRRAPIRGRVCMDQMLVDVTDLPLAEIGDEVILFGGAPDDFGKPPLPVWDVAQWTGTIPYEVTCMVSRRVPRVYEDADPPGRP